MKEELINPRKVKIPFRLLNYEKNLNTLDKLGYYLSYRFDLKENELLNVSKIWINKETSDKLDNISLEWIQKYFKCGKKRARKELGLYNLAIGPAVDVFNQFKLEDDYIYVEEDFIEIKDNK